MRGLRVNSFAGLDFPTCHILPEGTPAKLISWREEDDVRYGLINTGEELPILEVTLLDGRVFKLEAEDSTARAD